MEMRENVKNKDMERSLLSTADDGAVGAVNQAAETREPLLAWQRRDAVSIVKWCRSNKTLLKEHQVLFLCHSIWW